MTLSGVDLSHYVLCAAGGSGITDNFSIIIGANVIKRVVGTGTDLMLLKPTSNTIIVDRADHLGYYATLTEVEINGTFSIVNDGRMEAAQWVNHPVGNYIIHSAADTYYTLPKCATTIITGCSDAGVNTAICIDRVLTTTTITPINGGYGAWMELHFD